MADTSFDVLIIGSGPGGYVTAIRAAQLGFKTAIVERDYLGGICLNWGCIPTKALLRSSEISHLLKHLDAYGFSVKEVSYDAKKIVERSRKVAKQLSNGVAFLMKKHKITVFDGDAKDWVYAVAAVGRDDWFMALEGGVAKVTKGNVERYPTAPRQAEGLFVASPSSIYAFGDGELVVHHDGRQWNTEHVGPLPPRPRRRGTGAPDMLLGGYFSDGTLVAVGPSLVMVKQAPSVVTTTGTGSWPGVPSTMHSSTSSIRSSMTSSTSTQLRPGTSSTSRSTKITLPLRVMTPTSPVLNHPSETFCSKRSDSPT